MAVLRATFKASVSYHTSLWPWGHVAVGYLVFSGLSRVGLDRPPRGTEPIVVAVAALVPDLIDKTFAWTIPLLPNGRSLGHSLLLAAVIVIVVGLYYRCTDRPTLAAAFGVGYLSHPFADALQPLIPWEPSSLGYLGWPLVPALEYSQEQSFLAHLTDIQVTPFFLFVLGLVPLAVVVWVCDDTPGLGVVRSVRPGETPDSEGLDSARRR